mgnify:CR=1 FL=1
MTSLPRRTLVLGGARSGKSRHAEELIASQPAPWIYIATAQAFDEEMRGRIVAHRARRASGWHTVEAPLALADAIEAHSGRPILVDCLTLWLSNQMLSQPDALAAAIDTLLATLRSAPGPIVLVSNEVGLGIVPENALARAFRDEQGRLNQAVAALAERVVFMAAGLPLTLKG